MFIQKCKTIDLTLGEVFQDIPVSVWGYKIPLFPYLREDTMIFYHKDTKNICTASEELRVYLGCDMVKAEKHYGKEKEREFIVDMSSIYEEIKTGDLYRIISRNVIYMSQFDVPSFAVWFTKRDTRNINLKKSYVLNSHDFYETFKQVDNIE